MATWQVIENVGETLRGILQRRFDDDLGASVVSVRSITPASFAQLSSTNSPVLSLFLYRIEENRVVRNQSSRRLADGSTSPPPLALDLCYLLTAWAARSADSAADVDADQQAAQEEYRMLGRVLQTLAVAGELTPELLVDDPNAPVFNPGDNLQLILESMPLEDHYRIWDASELSYRLSLTYRVRVAGIDPLESVPAPRVQQATTSWGAGT